MDGDLERNAHAGPTPDAPPPFPPRQDPTPPETPADQASAPYPGASPAPPSEPPETAPESVEERGLLRTPPSLGARRGRALRIAGAVLALVLVGPPLAVVVYRVIPPPITALMVERLIQGQGLHKHWVPLDDIDPSLPNAVIAAEDQRFCTHHGFDFDAIRKAVRANAGHPGKLRGGSTISQQTAKNVFLWPGRDYVRKGLESYFTVLIEALWGKRRIMETYLNVAEWGPGTYGAEAAARRYFDEPAIDIDPGEASRLAAILPSPLKWKAVDPGRYVEKRSRKIGAAAGAIRRDGLARCLR